MPEPRSSRNKNTKLLRRLSTIKRDIIKYTRIIREIYQTNKSREGSSQD
jgi:hypothetical protein